MKKKIFVVAALFISSHLLAQDDSSYRSLDEVIFIANKYLKKQSETGKVVTVIPQMQLERSSGRTLGEVLNSVAGITIPGANNNLGTNQTVNIRGASAGNVLLLMDGIPLTDPSVNNNYLDLNFFSIDQIERIEILKGGQSTLYGSDAVAGVVNIITRKKANKKFEMNAGLAAGSYGTFKQIAGINGNRAKSNYGLHYTHLNSNGFSAAFDSSGNKDFDRDGFDLHALSAIYQVHLSDKLQAKIFGQFNTYKADLDAAAFIDERDHTVKNRNVQSGVGLTHKLDNGNLHFNYHFNYVSRDYLDDSLHKSNPFVDYSESYFIGRTHFAELYSNWNWKRLELLTGIDYRYNGTLQDYFSTGMFGPFDPPMLSADMSQFSPYASFIYKNQGLNVEFGGRWNNHSEYGNNFTYTFNPSFQVNKDIKIFGNLYSAFKAPTLYQLFDPSAGNADLNPETSIIVEAGFSITSENKFMSRVTGYHRKAEDAIQYITINPSTFAARYENVSRQTNYGVELETSYRVEKFSFHANYTFTDGETRSRFDGTGFPLGKDTTYYNLYRIPKHSVNVSAGVQATKNLFVNTQLRTISKREEFIYGSTPETLEGYYTIDVYGEYRFNRVKIFADFKNITDQKYFDIPGYNSRRFNFMGGFLYKF